MTDMAAIHQESKLPMFSFCYRSSSVLMLWTLLCILSVASCHAVQPALPHYTSDTPAAGPVAATADILFAVAKSADSKLAATVREGITIADSLVETRGGSVYQLHVLFGHSQDVVPVAIQLQDMDSQQAIVTAALYSRSRISCPPLVPNRGRLAYETEQLSLPTVIDFAKTKNKLVTVIVKWNGELYSVDNLSVSGRCLWGIQ